MTQGFTAVQRNFTQALRDSAWMIILFVVVFAAAAFVISEAQTKTYESTSRVTVQDPAIAITGTASTGQTVNALAAAEADRITRLGVSRAVATRIGNGMTPAQLASAVTTYVDPISNAVEITASARNAILAARIANAFAIEDAQQTNAEVQSQYAVQARQLEQEVAAMGRSADQDGVRAALTPELFRIQELALKAPEVQLAQLADPPSGPSSPKTGRNVGILAVIGLVLGIIVADIRRSRDHRVRVAEDVQILIDRPVIGRIAETVPRGRRAGRRSTREAMGADLEAARILRQNLRFLTDDSSGGVVLVTSATEGEGKSTVSVLLAQAGANAGSRTLLLECDLRQPVLAQRLATRGEVGLADYLRGAAEPSEIVKLVNGAGDGPDGTNGANDSTFSCITAGTGPRPPQMLESERFRQLIDQLRSSYDLIVVDGTQLLSVADAIELEPLVDCVALVVRLGRTQADQIVAASEALAQGPERPVGLVLTGVSAHTEAQ